MSLGIFRNDIASLEKLLCNLWATPFITRHKTMHSYCKIEDKCEEIAYNLALAFWLSSKSANTQKARFFALLSIHEENNQQEVGEQSNNYPMANKVFLTLENSSLLFALKNMLQELNIDELLHELETIKPSLSKKLLCAHENNYNILIIYRIMTEVLHLILYKVSQKKLPEKNYNDFVEAINSYIFRITHSDYILILCELLLKLMYIQLKHLKILVSNLSNSRDCFLINKRLALCLLEIIEKNMIKNCELETFSQKRLENLLNKVQEFRLKTSIVYGSQKMITRSCKEIQAFKRINLKGQEDFLLSFAPLRYDQVFKNKKLYASYYMDYMQLEVEVLLKLALGNQLFKEAQMLIEMFRMEKKSRERRKSLRFLPPSMRKPHKWQTFLRKMIRFSQSFSRLLKGILLRIRKS